MPSWRRASRVVVAALALGASACADGPAAAPAPLALPEGVARTSSFVGSPLSGPWPVLPPWLTGQACDPAAAWQVEVEWYVVRTVPGLALDALAAWTRLVVVGPDTAPSFGASLLAPGAVIGRVPQPDDFVADLHARSDVRRVATQRGALPPGVTTAFELTEANLIEDRQASSEAPLEAAPVRPRHVALLLYRPAPGTSARPRLFTVQASAPRPSPGPAAPGALGGLAGARRPGAASPSAVQRRRPDPRHVQVAVDVAGSAPGDDPCARGPRRRELLLLDEVVEPTGEALLLVTPSPLADGAEFPPWLLAVARVREAPRPGDPGLAAHREVLATTLASAQRACSASASPGRRDAGGALATLSLEAARLALRDPQEQRRALLELAAAVDAELLNMYALTGEHRIVDRIARRLAENLAGPGAPDTAPALRWLLERTTIDVVRGAYPARDVPPGTEAITSRYAGGVALRAAFLELFDAASSVEELHELLARENAALLDDASAGVRARAAEWLARERPELLPPDYDPLAPARERQAALARLRDLWTVQEGGAR